MNILDNLHTGRIQDINNLKDFGNRIKFFEGYIINIEDISRTIENCDYVINLAGQTSVTGSVENPFEDESINIRGFLNILKFAVDFRVKKVIQASSSAALGIQKMPIHELNVPQHVSPYGASKLAGEAYCSVYSYNYGLNCVALRFSNVFDPKSYNKGNVIDKFIKQIIKGESLTVYGDGNQTRDFIYVKDICDGIFLSLVKKLSGFNIFQLGTGIETSINSLITELSHILIEENIRMPNVIYVDKRKGEITHNYVDNSKAKEVLGFKVEYGLNEGLQNTLRWFLNNYK
ncbi:MAG: GDP-mannose 4,6-dehydratase [Promethearchaeota archaeon]